VQTIPFDVVTVRHVFRRLGRPVAAGLTRGWPPRSRLFLVGEDAGWSIDHDLLELGRLATRLGVRLAGTRLLTVSRGQAAFFGSQFTLLREPWRSFPHALGTAYFHGRPGTPGMPEFDVAYDALRAHHAELARVQVTHAEMRDLVLSSGIDPAKVFRIPIGVDLGLFEPQTPALRNAARRTLGLPEQAFVVGSFQKDGIGWGNGDEPKAIKGPDVLLEALRVFRERVPELHVLLSGPARGFVRSGLEALGIPYVHRRYERYEEIAQLYLALDAYVVPSRQEGGPKGVLEAMASGIPVVSTRVGQAAELIRDRVNGRLVEVEDGEGLADALGDPCLSEYVQAGRETALANGYDAQVPLWRTFFDGFVAHA
jgi:glycosyltransferase involved in cell wall biosynthesis